MRIGMLTGGGDCPGLNAVIRAIVRKGEGVYGHNIVGFRHGWRGVIEGEIVELDTATHPGPPAAGRHDPRSSRTNPFKTDDGVAQVLETLRDERVDALIAIGGEDTLGVAREARRRRRPGRRRAEDDRQRPVGDRLHVRLRHRGADRDRRDRPAAHDGRESTTGSWSSR